MGLYSLGGWVSITNLRERMVEIVCKGINNILFIY